MLIISSIYHFYIVKTLKKIFLPAFWNFHWITANYTHPTVWKQSQAKGTKQEKLFDFNYRILIKYTRIDWFCKLAFDKVTVFLMKETR